MAVISVLEFPTYFSPRTVLTAQKASHLPYFFGEQETLSHLKTSLKKDDNG